MSALTMKVHTYRDNERRGTPVGRVSQAHQERESTYEAPMLSWYLTRWLTLAVVARPRFLADRPNRRSVVTRVHSQWRKFVLPWRVWRSRRGPNAKAGSFGSPMSPDPCDASLTRIGYARFRKSFGGKNLISA